MIALAPGNTRGLASQWLWRPGRSSKEEEEGKGEAEARQEAVSIDFDIPLMEGRCTGTQAFLSPCNDGLTHPASSPPYEDAAGWNGSRSRYGLQHMSRLCET